MRDDFCFGYKIVGIYRCRGVGDLPLSHLRLLQEGKRQDACFFFAQRPSEGHQRVLVSQPSLLRLVTWVGRKA